ncbi:MAG: J domain-containing protein [Desulfobulbaceae bacterium]|nr:J domain-containing protein [Desulfobulbaceae bacterium]
MYLARIYKNQQVCFVLRHSFEEGGVLQSRDLFDLGDDPARFIIYPGGNSFYLSEEVEDALRLLGVVPGDDELENLMLPFVDPQIRYKVEPYMFRAAQKGRRVVASEEDEAYKRLHIFDMRRLYYLRYGNVDQRNILALPAKLFRPLFNKSRDELEQYLMAEESVLEAMMVKEYLYVAFNLQQFFSELIARSMPQGLDAEKMDEFFVTEVCKLNDDDGFWAGFTRGEVLPEYLARYVWQFFDSDFDPGGPWNEYARQFMNSRRQFNWPERPAQVAAERAAELFGTDTAILKGLSKRELTRLFREKAHEHHPDKGGEHDYFVELVSAYNDLLKAKK